MNNFLFGICFILGEDQKLILLPVVIVLCFALVIVSVVIFWLKWRERRFSPNKKEQETELPTHVSFENAPRASQEDPFASHEYQKLESVNVLYAGKQELSYEEI